MIFRLIYMNGAHKGERVTITREPMTLGRDKLCSISLADDPEAALNHCIIKHTDADELKIQDSGSMNRVLVNNHEVTDAKLKHGDTLEIGRTRLLVQAFVQADVNGNGTRPKRKKRSILMPAIALLVLTGVSVAGYRKISDAVAKNKIKPPSTEVIPPSIFKDMQAVEQIPPAVKTATTSTTIEENITPAPPPPTPTPVAKIDKPVVPQPEPPIEIPKPAPKPKPIPRPEPVVELPPPIVIVDLSQQKFPQNPEYDEMRVATLKLRTTGSVIDDSKVAVKFEFFDRDLTSGEITPARAIVPLKAVTTTSLAANRTETLSAAYTVPKGLRTAQSAVSGHTFYGVVASVMYGGELVAQKAIPSSLLKEN